MAMDPALLYGLIGGLGSMNSQPSSVPLGIGRFSAVPGGFLQGMMAYKQQEREQEMEKRRLEMQERKFALEERAMQNQMLAQERAMQFENAARAKAMEEELLDEQRLKNIQNFVFAGSLGDLAIEQQSFTPEQQFAQVQLANARNVDEGLSAAQSLYKSPAMSEPVGGDKVAQAKIASGIDPTLPFSALNEQQKALLGTTMAEMNKKSALVQIGGGGVEEGVNQRDFLRGVPGLNEPMMSDIVPGTAQDDVFNTRQFAGLTPEAQQNQGLEARALLQNPEVVAALEQQQAFIDSGAETTKPTSPGMVTQQTPGGANIYEGEFRGRQMKVDDYNLPVMTDIPRDPRTPPTETPSIFRAKQAEAVYQNALEQASLGRYGKEAVGRAEKQYQIALKRAEKIENQVADLSKRIVESGLSDVFTTVENIYAVGRQTDWDLAGTGIESFKPGGFLTDSGIPFTKTLEDTSMQGMQKALANKMITLRTGAAMGVAEAQRIGKELGLEIKGDDTNWWVEGFKVVKDSVFKQGLQQLADSLYQQLGRIEGSYDAEAKELFYRRIPTAAITAADLRDYVSDQMQERLYSQDKILRWEDRQNRMIKSVDERALLQPARENVETISFEEL